MHAKAVEQAEALNQAQGDDYEKAGVRNQGQQAAKTKTHTLCQRELRSVLNQARGNGIKRLDGYVAHALEVWHPHAVFLGKLFAEGFGVDFDGTQTAQRAEADQPSGHLSRK